MERDSAATGAVGMGKWCSCGVKLPVDDITIEKHPKGDLGDEGNPGLQWKSPAISIKYNLKTVDLETRDGVVGSTMFEPEGTTTSYAELEDDSQMNTSLEDPLDPDEDCGLDDWEDGFDAIGIAKCSHCGMKLPLDDEAIEEHLRTCQGEGIQHSQPQNGASCDSAVLATEAMAAPAKIGKCCRCQMVISLDVESVVAHSHVCPALVHNQGSAVDTCGSKYGWLSNFGL